MKDHAPKPIEPIKAIITIVEPMARASKCSRADFEGGINCVAAGANDARSEEPL